MTEENLAGYFADCGKIVDCRICGDPNSAMRFAFIEFMDLDSAAKVWNARGAGVRQARSFRATAQRAWWVRCNA